MLVSIPLNYNKPPCTFCEIESYTVYIQSDRLAAPSSSLSRCCRISARVSRRYISGERGTGSSRLPVWITRESCSALLTMKRGYILPRGNTVVHTQIYDDGTSTLRHLLYIREWICVVHCVLLNWIRDAVGYLSSQSYKRRLSRLINLLSGYLGRV